MRPIKNSAGEISYKAEYEYWYERIYVVVEDHTPAPKGYVRTNVRKSYRLASFYTRPGLVWAFNYSLKVSRMWWKSAQYFKNNGLLILPEKGDRISRFWPKYMSIKKVAKRLFNIINLTQ